MALIPYSPVQTTPIGSSFLVNGYVPYGAQYTFTTANGQTVQIPVQPQMGLWGVAFQNGVGSNLGIVWSAPPYGLPGVGSASLVQLF